MLEMGIPTKKAELALSETGNVGVQVAAEWLVSVPDHVLERHLASNPNTPVEQPASGSDSEQRCLLPRRVPLQVSCKDCRVCWCMLLLSKISMCRRLSTVIYLSAW